MPKASHHASPTSNPPSHLPKKRISCPSAKLHEAADSTSSKSKTVKPADQAAPKGAASDKGAAKSAAPKRKTKLVVFTDSKSSDEDVSSDKEPAKKKRCNKKSRGAMAEPNLDNDGLMFVQPDSSDGGHNGDGGMKDDGEKDEDSDTKEEMGDGAGNKHPESPEEELGTCLLVIECPNADATLGV